MPTRQKRTPNRAKKTSVGKGAAKKLPRSKRLKQGVIRITTESGASFTTAAVDDARRRAMQRFAMQWAYTVRNRDRWLNTPDAQRKLHERASETLADMGIGPDVIEAVSRAKLIEVAMPYAGEEVGWESRIFPWEYVLSAAVRFCGERWRSLVVRHLQRPGALPTRGPTRRVLIVTSCPGALRDRYTFDNECSLVRTNLKSGGDDGVEFQRIENPSAAQLQQRIEEWSPDVVHLSGVDTHQGDVLLQVQKEGATSRHGRRDGFYLADDDGNAVTVEAERLGAILNAGKSNRPALVFINTFNSASRLAAMAVAHGAGAAVGFQDTIDDQLAESFLGNFYRAWVRSESSGWAAFDFAWERLRRQPRSLRGSGVVFWSERSFEAAYQHDERLAESLEEERLEIYRPAKGEHLRDVLDVDYEAPVRINYSTLHNNSDLFQRFRLTKKTRKLLPSVDVSVSLKVGADEFSYRSLIDIDQNPVSLNEDIRIPLTWDYVRNLNESVRSSLYVEVSKDGDILQRKTHGVTLQPVQEWEDTDENRAWLPSFVLPRDAHVARIMAHAERYLRALTDYRDAGFDGYQSIDPDADQPGDSVDLQVRAIWSALVFEHDLMYINPPPSYAYGSQRLRTPSEVIESGHGTCIDLTLLFAACLEYVEIYPAIFLLTGHAFPAYWRSHYAYEDFASMRHANEDIAASDARAGVVYHSGRFDTARRYKDWMISGETSHQAILASIRRGELVPIEAVAMTAGGGFADAIEQGMENVEAIDEFESLIDIPLARQEYGVTPLPF